jgi:hypothetical protein
MNVRLLTLFEKQLPVHDVGNITRAGWPARAAGLLGLDGLLGLAGLPGLDNAPRG